MSQNAEGNIHVAEERGQVLLRDNEDEEIQYSGVIRRKLKNPMKFKGFHKKLVERRDVKQEKENGIGLINYMGWDVFKFKGEKKPVAQTAPA